MAVSDFSVNPSDLKAAAQEINAQASKLQSDYRAMFQRVEALTKVWDSEDGRKFMADMKKYQPDFEALNKALLNSAVGIDEAANIYIKAQSV